KAVSICQQSRSWDDKHVRTPEPHKTLNPPVKLAWYSNKNPSRHSKQWISGEPGFNEPLRNWNSLDLVGCNGSLRTCADTGNLSIRLVTPKMAKNGLKSTLITEISRIKVPKKGNPLPLFFVLFHNYRSFRKCSPQMSPYWENGCAFWSLNPVARRASLKTFFTDGRTKFRRGVVKQQKAVLL